MYSIWAFLSGVILAVMIQMNGGLSEAFGVYHAALYIHIVGALFAAVMLFVRKERLNLQKEIPLWMYGGGVIGVLTTVFNNLAFAGISLTSIVALGLFGQLVFSCLIDRFGWFGMEKRGQEDLSLPGILCSAAGIVLMLENPASGGWVYVLISLGAGITVVLSRTINARLSEKTGALPGSFVNHLAGLPFCFVLACIIPEVSAPTGFRVWIWGGGILGVITVAICNAIVPRIAAYRLTLFTMCGQLFCGIFLDLLSGSALNRREFGAGLLVAAGIAAGQISKIYKQKISL
ncbi:MAG: DMT family transporter [Lachnospiraceae bacterium]|nr:DMT family transporter [Lachnospiraceae bacterium]